MPSSTAFDFEEGNGNPAMERKASRYGFIHVPARGSIRVTMLCHEAIRYRAHWINSQKRFIPHLTNGCKCTTQELGFTVRWCYGVYEEDSRRIGLLELGASQAEIITQAAERFGSLRGLQFTLRKPDQTVKGRIECGLYGAGKVPEGELAMCPDIKKMLTGLWQDADTKRLVG